VKPVEPVHLRAASIGRATPHPAEWSVWSLWFAAALLGVALAHPAQAREQIMQVALSDAASSSYSYRLTQHDGSTQRRMPAMAWINGGMWPKEVE
jgi:hypothetical protein